MRTSDELMIAWAQGWMAASQAIMQALQESARSGFEPADFQKADFLAAAGNKPSAGAGSQAGEARTSLGPVQAKRPRGRPRKFRPEQLPAAEK